ncbi:hypothetical protein SAMN05428950_101895 [Sphingomonas sp. OV641]|uniref:hypothetical protein n=1 Tax=Sphingomonas sp. OV641 TaxID=1881068 RepID=UPI0008C1B822|nr:hypothetical protein [Sphingomonas sp. OV641]SEJ02843.1 hypothetical protein SAMN05428950_101895 [Sphingomonas sp. OV641]
MIDPELIIASITSLLGGGAVGSILTYRREAKKSAEEVTDMQWQRLANEITRLDERSAKDGARIDALEKEVRDCHREKSMLEGKVIKLEAAIEARGEIRQRAAEVVAAERLLGATDGAGASSG